MRRHAHLNIVRIIAQIEIKLSEKTDRGSSAWKDIARISHKDRCERPESAVDARNSVKKHADILKYFEDAFLRCDAAGMVLSGLVADRL